jgi:hypothetical protein
MDEAGIRQPAAASVGLILGADNPKPKHHFVFLDGLRGVAALLVGWLHASQLFSLSYSPAHAFLAP